MNAQNPDAAALQDLLSNSVAKDFGLVDWGQRGYMFEVNIHEGAVCVDIANELDSAWYCFPHEQEVLVYPVNTVTVTHYSDCNGGLSDVLEGGNTGGGAGIPSDVMIHVGVTKRVRVDTLWDTESLIDDHHWTIV